MTSEQSAIPNPKSAIRCWFAAGLLCLLAGSAIRAQDTPPPFPTLNFEQTPSCAVMRVTAKCGVNALVVDEERTFVLSGVTVPGDKIARTRLQRFLENLLTGEDVYIQPEPAVGNPQSEISNPESPALVCLFRAPDGLFVNLEAVRQGYAKVCAKPNCEQLDLLRHYEQRARKARKGIWAPRPARNPQPVISKPVKTDEIIVYVTKSGKKYHREGCQHLRKSSRAISLKEALEKGYEPCTRCKPPTKENP